MKREGADVAQGPSWSSTFLVALSLLLLNKIFFEFDCLLTDKVVGVVKNNTEPDFLICSRSTNELLNEP
jgi:hypothetical protein